MCHVLQKGVVLLLLLLLHLLLLYLCVPRKKVFFFSHFCCSTINPFFFRHQTRGKTKNTTTICHTCFFFRPEDFPATIVTTTVTRFILFTSTIYHIYNGEGRITTTHLLPSPFQILFLAGPLFAIPDNRPHVSSFLCPPTPKERDIL